MRANRPRQYWVHLGRLRFRARHDCTNLFGAPERYGNRGRYSRGARNKGIRALPLAGWGPAHGRCTVRGHGLVLTGAPM